MADYDIEFIPHAERISLEGSASQIEKRLLPVPDYYAAVWEKHEGAHPFDIERSIIQQWKTPFGEKDAYGAYWYEHILRFMKMLMPKTIITPWLMDEVAAMQMALSEKRDMINYIGSKSSGKSALMARMANTLVAADPEYSICYAAAPYKNSADYTIWGEIENCFREIMDNHADVYPDIRHVPSLNKCIFANGRAKAGRIELVGLDRVARLQGAKSEDQLRGFLFVVADEVAVFESRAFVEILANITVNLNFLASTGCNFKDPLGLEGDICSPQGSEYSDLNIDRDHLWRSDFNSITLRLDGHKSPNVTEQRIIYPFLLNEEKRQVMEDIHGVKGPKYLEQVRSFPNMSSADNYILTMEQLRSGGAFDDFFERTGQWTRVAFCDPGWQGDPCKIGAFEFGPARVQTHDGTMRDSYLIQPLEAIQQIKVEANMIADAEYMARLDEHSDAPVMMKEGREVTMDNQIALQCAEYLRKHGIQKQWFGFDASCRGSITQEMVTVLGREIKVYDFQSKATAMPIDSSGTMAFDKYRNLRTEMYFLSQLVVLAGQLRGGHEVMDALGQICRHRYLYSGSKIGVEPKDDYKKANQAKSPDAADVFVGALHVARGAGLPLSFSRQGRAAPALSLMGETASLRPRPAIKRLNRHG